MHEKRGSDRNGSIPSVLNKNMADVPHGLPFRKTHRPSCRPEQPAIDSEFLILNSEFEI